MHRFDTEDQSDKRIKLPIFLICEIILLCLFFLFAFAVHAQSKWQQQEIFSNSISPRSYFYSEGIVSGPSKLELIDKKLPVETSTFVSAPNSLKLAWQSTPGGGWDAEITLAAWPNRYINYLGDTLYLWVYSPEAMAGTQLPLICLHDTANGFTEKLKLGEFAHALPTKKWTRIAIPIRRFASVSVHPFQPDKINTVILIQGATDDRPHVLFLDDIRIENASEQNAPAPPVPKGLRATGYEKHVELSWDPIADEQIEHYVLYRSLNGAPYVPVAVQNPETHRAVDFVGDAHANVSYKVTARTSALHESAMSAAATASTHPLTDDELLTMVQKASFEYYWDGAEPHSGLARESIPGDPDLIAVGGSGFGIMALVVGAERGFVPREQVVDRMLRITSFLAHADRYHGAWPHFLSGSTGKLLPYFGLYDDGADLVETSFLMQGLLAARGYFTHDTPKERQLRAEITSLWNGVEWDWFNATPKHDALYWHWSPNFGFHKANRIGGWNETLMPYLLGIASPTHPIPASLYYSGWAAEGDSKRKFGTHSEAYGLTLTVADPNGSTGPLFFTHYSFMGYDPRNFRDKYANYFTNNRNASLIQQRYAIANPQHYKGYGENEWGMSAVTGPHGYRAYHPPSTDDGTLAPTAAMGAYAYAPEASLVALKHFYRDLGPELLDVYGFRNAFNETEDWYSVPELALNQAPQAVMIENGRTGLIWRSFMSNPEIPAMQKAIGLMPDTK
jgi:exo beta-1,2-glucooligosaccharide sophorohydrolase (non-reducing end)